PHGAERCVVGAGGVPIPVRDPPGPPAALRAGRVPGAGVPAVRHGVVSVSDAPDGGAAGQHVVLRVEPDPWSPRGMTVSEQDWRKVAFLGGGKMGGALVSGLVRSGGRRGDEITGT